MKQVLAVVLGSMVLVAGAQAACSNADKAALEKLDRDWGTAALAGDRAALEAIYAEHYVDLQPGNVSGRKFAIDSSVEDAAKASAAGAATSSTEHDFYLINCTDNSALITHRNVTTEGAGDETTTSYTRSVHQLEKKGGKWQVVSNATHALDDAAIVGYLDLEWNIAEVAVDRAWFERNLSPDYIGVSSRDGAMEHKGEFLAQLGKFKVTAADTSDMNVRVEGKHATVSGVYRTRGTDEKGKAFERRTRYIDIFAKRDGRWQITSSQGTQIKD
jgi:ketosteroid isomerase-like protein